MFMEFFQILGLVAGAVIISLLVGYNLGCDEAFAECDEYEKKLITYYENRLKEKGSN